jgi:uncharacterized protein (TIGR02757 family)
MREIKALLDAQLALRERDDELSYERPDPLMVARRYNEEYAALVCALFGYGNAHAIVRFLDRLDMELLEANEATIRRATQTLRYRFQTPEDVAALFIALSRLKRQNPSLETLFCEGYAPHRNILAGLRSFIGALREAYAFQSPGYDFLAGKPPHNANKAGAYKRYMMFLRWMVRRDGRDMGLWRCVDKRDLVIPLDTHTAAVSRKLGLLRRKSNDFKAAVELTETLRRFDENDPVKYDFALYRIGQEKIALS